MTRIYRPVSGWEDELRVHVPSCTALEPEPLNKFSGLLDATGSRLMVTELPEPIGFVVFRDR